MSETENRKVKAEDRREETKRRQPKIDKEPQKTTGDRGGYAGGNGPSADPDPERT